MYSITAEAARKIAYISIDKSLISIFEKITKASAQESFSINADNEDLTTAKIERLQILGFQNHSNPYINTTTISW